MIRRLQNSWIAATLAILGLAALGAMATAASDSAETTCKLVKIGPNGKLVYEPNRDGDTILDFSNCGYKGGGVRLPDAPVIKTLEPQNSNDDTERIQSAIDEVSKLPRDPNGLRGAVLLKIGVYRIGKSLKIAASGVVLRGEGNGENDTVLIATGHSVRSLIAIGAPGNSSRQDISEEDDTPADIHLLDNSDANHQPVTESRVPVGARSFHVRNPSGFKVGDTLHVSRVGNAEWIHEIAMDLIKPINGDRELVQWKPFTLKFDRVITAIDGDRITVDAPIACAIESKWGGGDVSKYPDTDRIEQCGVEKLYSISEYDKSKTETLAGKEYPCDENHALRLVTFGRVKNAWARDLTAEHFCHGVSSCSDDSKWITIQDCRALDPVSEITGGRRYPFSIAGQLVLVRRCYARRTRHAFAVSARVCGPNVFLDCKSEHDYATSEPHHRWSVGGLYDNVQGEIQFADRGALGTGQGWAGANYVAWNCTGSLICEHPPTAENYAFGFVGKKHEGPFHRPDGYWEDFGHPISPRSLYLQQLEDRLGSQAVSNIAK